MIFHYLVTDTNSDETITYSVDACDKRDADEVFIKRFFPLLPDVDAMDITTIINICRDLDYDIKVINPIKTVKLN